MIPEPYSYGESVVVWIRMLNWDEYEPHYSEQQEWKIAQLNIFLAFRAQGHNS